jgi:hypothetical protein
MVCSLFRNWPSGSHDLAKLLSDVAPELIDQVFQHLDKATLSQCALVSRDWRVMAHRHLFRVVTLKDTGYTDRGIQLLEESTFLGKFIQEVLIDVPEGTGMKEFTLKGFLFLEMLECVTSLTLSRIFWTARKVFSEDRNLRKAVVRSLENVFPTLESLSLQHCGFSTIQDLECFVRAAPNLRRLDISYVTWSANGTNKVKMFASLPQHNLRLSSFYFSQPTNTDSYPLIKMLRPPAFEMSLRMLVVHWFRDFYPLQSRSYEELVRRVGRTLETVMIRSRVHLFDGLHSEVVSFLLTIDAQSPL